MTMQTRPHVFTFTQRPWDSDVWVDRHYLMEALALRDWPVIYSTGALSVWDRGKPAWQNAPLLGRLQQQSIDGAHHVLTEQPGKLLAHWPSMQAWNRLAMRLQGRRLRRALPPQHTGPVIAYLCGTRYAEYADQIDASHVVLHINDAWWTFPNWGPEDDRRLQAVAERADLIVAIAETMTDRLPPSAMAKVKILPHGVKAQNYIDGHSLPCPADLAAIAGPRIGYVGRISRKVDVDLLLALAEQRPQWQIVAVGDVEVGTAGDQAFTHSIERCRNMPNIHLLGVRPHSDMPAYMAHMDVNIMCYKLLGGYWERISPLKLFEYLAAGPPIVAADLENLRPHSDVLNIARSTDEWLECIDNALLNDSAEQRDKRQQVARHNSWQARAEQLEQWLLDTVNDQPAQTAP